MIQGGWMLEALRKLVLQKFDTLKLAENHEITKGLDGGEQILFSMKAIKINQRSWKQARSIVITTKGLYNFNGNSNRRFVEAGKIRGVIYSSKSYELIIHIPSEYDYHYNINEHMEKLIYYLYLCKQLNSKTPAELYLIKTDIEFLGSYAVKEQQKKEEDFKRLEGVSYTKELYKSKIKFDLFTDPFKVYLQKTGIQVFNQALAFPTPGDNPSEFDAKMIEPILVLHSSKIGRVLLVQNKQTKNKYALKYFYRWKLVKYGEEEKLLKVLHRLAQYVRHETDAGKPEEYCENTLCPGHKHPGAILQPVLHRRKSSLPHATPQVSE